MHSRRSAVGSLATRRSRRFWENRVALLYSLYFILYSFIHSFFNASHSEFDTPAGLEYGRITPHWVTSWGNFWVT